jgi:uncharacterized membrane protein
LDFRNYANREKLTFFLKKNASFDRLAFSIFVGATYYFAGSVAGAGVIGAGVAAFGVTASVLSMIFESVPNEPPKLKLESNINKINIPPKVQVLLSKKSVVFCTPPICVDPPNEEESPPPLGF